MQHPHNEVLLTFMYEGTNRFLTPQTGGYSAISQLISRKLQAGLGKGWEAAFKNEYTKSNLPGERL